MKLAAYSFAMLVALGLIFMMNQAVVPQPLTVTVTSHPSIVPVLDQPLGKTYKVTSSDQLTPAFVDIAHQILNQSNNPNRTTSPLATNADASTQKSATEITPH